MAAERCTDLGMMPRRAVVALLAGVVLLAAGCGGDDAGPSGPVDAPPVACFIASPLQAPPGTEVGFDASCTRDAEDPTDSLSVRWDWESDGIWDTEWNRSKQAVHRFDQAVSAKVSLEARDLSGQTAVSSRIVSVTEDVPSVPLEGFVMIPAGSFFMGRPAEESGRRTDEGRHEVRLDRPFRLAEHEVTQEEWQEVMGWNPSFFRGDARPVETVTWFDCIAFCIQKSEEEGVRPAYQLAADTIRVGHHIVAGTVWWDTTSTSYRLPTEAEWEYACRAGTSSAFSSGPIADLHCGVNPDLDPAAYFCGNSDERSHPVGEKLPNPWGLVDMHGNVMEWCWDWMGAYPDGPVVEPAGPETGLTRALRGGAWANWSIHCRSAARGARDPGSFNHSAGFRLARSIRSEKRPS